MTRAAARRGCRSSTSRPTACAEREIAAARPDQAGQMRARAQPLAEGVRERAHVKAGRAHQTQAQRGAAPLDDLERCAPSPARAAAAPARSGAPDRRRDRRRFSWRRRRGLLQVRAAELRNRLLDHRQRQLGTRRACGRARRRRRRDRASLSLTPSSMSASYSFSARREKLREPRRLADDERQHAGRERIERAGMADLHRRSRADRARAHTATTSCDVGPAGLSMTMTPSGKEQQFT